MWVFFDIPRKRDLGQTEVYHCRYCGTERPFNLVLAYKLAALNVVFCWVHGRQFWRLCNYCECGWKVPAEDLAPLPEPIPFWERFGWALCLFVGVVVVLVVLLIMASRPGHLSWD
jgi:hypothetical protein